jgi:AhpD family alkylhydroperoxidase
MKSYRVHTIESAPERSKASLEGLKQAVGRVPNLAATMAESPPLVNGFVGAFGTFHGGSFDGAQKQVLLLTNAVTNACTWAVAFHSTLALKEGVTADGVRAIRERRLPADRRHAALSSLSRALIETRGHVEPRERAAFIEAGFAHDQVLEVILGVAVSTMANLAGNITDPPLEEPFKAQAWSA